MFKIGHFSKYIVRSELVRSASILAIGTIIAQAIPILLQPFLRRYFLPEEFGVFSVYTSIIGILMVVASFRYEQAIVLPKHNTDSTSLLGLSIIIAIFFSTCLLIIVFFIKESIVSLINIPKATGYFVYLIPLGVLLLSLFHSFNFWLVRKKAFGAISSNKIARRSVEGIFQSLFAIKGVSGGLIWGDLIGQIANVLTSWYQASKKGLSFKSLNLNRIFYLAKKYSDLPKYNLITSALSAASYLLPVIFINRIFSSEYAGFFDLSKLMLSIPLALIATSFSSVILQRVSEGYRMKQSIIHDLKPIIIIVVAIAVVEIFIISFIGIDIFTLFFGEEWRYSGVISKLLVWAFALNFIASTFTSVFVALNRIVFQSGWQVLYFILIISMLFFDFQSFEQFILVYTTIEIFCSLLLIGLIFHSIRKFEISNKCIG